ncbi:MAG: tetratricopeptide repeat protein [Elusimicrobia bacterium]|nr:tetratricopeptide repeat protein [Elusimicrobiota bacterium]
MHAGALAVIVIATLAAFWPSLSGQFLNWDDYKFYVINPHYRGLGWAQLRWMFTTTYNGPYQPLAWISLACDFLLWGMDPFGYHLTSLVLHCLAAVVLYGVIQQLLALARGPDGALRAACAVFGTLVFAVHPLRVESVAWVSERRDVLSGLFYLATIAAYLKAQSQQDRAKARLWRTAALASFVLSLLAKGMGVTLPAVLLVLDVYPLRRLPAEPSRWFSRESRAVWFEKAPFAAAALAAAGIGFWGQYHGGVVRPLVSYRLAQRTAQACYGLAFYLWKTAAPVRLSPLYPLPRSLDPWMWPFLVSAAAMAALGALLFRLRRRHPEGLAAFAHYLLTLSPVIGFVQFGPQIAADRYSYLSCLAVAVLAAGGAEELCGALAPRAWTPVLVALALAAGALGGAARRQSRVWHDSQTLWRQAVAADPESAAARSNLASALFVSGSQREAVDLYRQAIVLDPELAETHTSLGAALDSLGRAREAMGEYREAVRLDPRLADARANLGAALLKQGMAAEAAAQYREAVSLKPEEPRLQHELGVALLRLREPAAAAERFRAAVRLNPDFADELFVITRELVRERRFEDAAFLLRQVLRDRPELVMGHYNLGVVLEDQHRPLDAVEEFKAALAIDPRLRPKGSTPYLETGLRRALEKLQAAKP